MAAEAHYLMQQLIDQAAQIMLMFAPVIALGVGLALLEHFVPMGVQFLRARILPRFGFRGSESKPETARTARTSRKGGES